MSDKETKNKLLTAESLIVFAICLGIGIGNDYLTLLGDAVLAFLSIVFAIIIDRLLNPQNKNIKNTGAIVLYSIPIFLIGLWCYNVFLS